MARQVAEISGVSEAVFSAHKHNYRKPIQLGVSNDEDYDPAYRFDVVDDSEVVAYAGSNLDLEAIGLTVATEPTTTPV